MITTHQSTHHNRVKFDWQSRLVLYPFKNAHHVGDATMQIKTNHTMSAIDLTLIRHLTTHITTTHGMWRPRQTVPPEPPAAAAAVAAAAVAGVGAGGRSAAPCLPASSSSPFAAQSGPRRPRRWPSPTGSGRRPEPPRYPAAAASRG